MTPEEELALAALRDAESDSVGVCPVCCHHEGTLHRSGCSLKLALDALERKRDAPASVAADFDPLRIGHPSIGHCDLCNGDCQLKC